MQSDPDYSRSNYATTIERLDTLGMQVGRAYGDWLDIEFNQMTPQLESKVEELTKQFDMLASNVYLLINYLREISNA